MTSFFHDLEDQLRAAAQAHTSSAGAPEDDARQAPRRRARGRWAWLAGGARALPVVVAVAVTLAIVVGALLVLVPGHSHTPPTPPAGGGLGPIPGGHPSSKTQRELRYIGQATSPVVQSAACLHNGPHHVQLIHSRPSPAVLGALGLLRRPATSADHLATNTLNAAAPVYAGYVRRAFSVAGTSYYVYVQRDTGAEYPSDHCLTLEQNAVNRALPTMPASLRAPTRTLEARLVAYQRKLKARPRQDTLCFAVQAQNGGSSECGATLAQIQNGFIAAATAGAVSGIVPDGVASVTLDFSAGGGYPTRSYTATVRSNVYTQRVPGAFAGSGGQPTAIWHAPDGHTLKVIRARSYAAQRHACQKQPVECFEGGGSIESSGSSSSTVPATATPHPRSAG